MPRSLVLAVLLAASLAALAAPAIAEPIPLRDARHYVKYYEVGVAVQGQPETLADIATRLLGDAGRDGELLVLNEGRPQADGGVLTGDGVLRPGWLLVLPWDAFGPGVVMGQLPAPRGTPGATPPPATPTPPPGDGSGPAAGATCQPVPAEASATMQWPRLRLGPDRAWETTKGDGVTVAVIDTGVDTAAPALAGRVVAGVGVGTGSGAVCAGHGTALAGIVAAQPVGGSNLIGIAPEAKILPVTVDLDRGTVPPTQLAAALTAAADANAAVAMLGVPVDLTVPQVTAALAEAVARDVLVVVGAWGGTAPPGVLRVGAVTPDDRLAREYPSGSLDVLAPGEGIVTLGPDGGIAGSGTDFAVPFVAGLAALVRSASPETSVVGAADHIVATAERVTSGPGAGGIIDLDAAIDGLPGADPDGSTGTGTGTGGDGAAGAMPGILITAAVALLLILGLLAPHAARWANAVVRR